jgi:hypothetical protein
MSLARYLASLLNSSGQVPDAKLVALTASKLSGQVPDANAPSGSVIQVVQGSTTSMATSSNNSTWIATNLTASITPTNASNKILVIGQHGSARVSSGLSNGIQLRLLRNSTVVINPVIEFLYSYVGLDGPIPFQYLDSPATTSSTTYSTEFKLLTAAGSTAQINPNSTPALITLLEISA